MGVPPPSASGPPAAAVVACGAQVVAGAGGRAVGNLSMAPHCVHPFTTPLDDTRPAGSGDPGQAA